MQSAKRVILVPPSQTGGSIEADSGSLAIDVGKTEKIDKIKFKIFDKIRRFCQVIMDLAENKSYDRNTLKIRKSDGSYLDKSNVVDLLIHAMSVGKVLYGEDEFIALLAKCNIDPDLIMNENVKTKLIN